jgi:hypothetical protein
MLLAIGEFALRLWFVAGIFVFMGAIISLGSLILAQFAPPEKRPATIRLLWARYIQNIETFATAMIRMLLGFFFNRTSLIGFTIFLGAQAVAAADPSKASECAAVIAMSLLWVCCDSILRGFSVGVSLFEDGPQEPLHRQAFNAVADLVRTYAAIPGRIASRMKAA